MEIEIQIAQFKKRLNEIKVNTIRLDEQMEAERRTLKDLFHAETVEQAESALEGLIAEREKKVAQRDALVSKIETQFGGML